MKRDSFDFLESSLMSKSLNVHDAVFPDLRRWRSCKYLKNPVECTTNRED